MKFEKREWNGNETANNRAPFCGLNGLPYSTCLREKVLVVVKL